MLGRGWAKRRRTDATYAAGVPRLRPAGSACTSASTTPPASPTSRSLPDEKATTAIGFLRRAIAFYRSHSISVQRLITDNGSAYLSVAHALACQSLGISHFRTRPYRPQTNGNAERFILTMLRESAYAAVYGTSPEGRGPLRVARSLQLHKHAPSVTPPSAAQLRTVLASTSRRGLRPETSRL